MRTLRRHPHLHADLSFSESTRVNRKCFSVQTQNTRCPCHSKLVGDTSREKRESKEKKEQMSSTEIAKTQSYTLEPNHTHTFTRTRPRWKAKDEICGRKVFYIFNLLLLVFQIYKQISHTQWVKERDRVDVWQIPTNVNAVSKRTWMGISHTDAQWK